MARHESVIVRTQQVSFHGAFPSFVRSFGSLSTILHWWIHHWQGNICDIGIPTRTPCRPKSGPKTEHGVDMTWHVGFLQPPWPSAVGIESYQVMICSISLSPPEKLEAWHVFWWDPSVPHPSNVKSEVMSLQYEVAVHRSNTWNEVLQVTVSEPVWKGLPALSWQNLHQRRRAEHHFYLFHSLLVSFLGQAKCEENCNLSSPSIPDEDAKTCRASQRGLSYVCPRKLLMGW